jgi:hypothetical protein
MQTTSGVFLAAAYTENRHEILNALGGVIQHVFSKLNP